MSDEFTHLVLRGLQRHAYEPIREHFNLDSCIASTRIGLDVLDYFGIVAAPMPLAVLIFNEEAIQLLEGGMGMDELAQHLRSIPKSEAGTPWSIGLGYGGDPEPGKWAGHLVAAVPHARTLVDLSIKQAERTQKGLIFNEPMLWLCDDDEWWAGRKLVSEPMMYADDDNKRRLLAIFDTEDRQGELQKYKTTGNWNRRPPSIYRQTAGKIIRAIKADLDSTGGS